MEYPTPIAEWRQTGRICLWRFKPMKRMYSGWHFSADEAGCDSLLELISLLSESTDSAHRTLDVTDPAEVGADRVVGRHGLKFVTPAKLRIAYYPQGLTGQSALAEMDDRLAIALDHDGLNKMRGALEDVRRGIADFSVEFDSHARDPMMRMSFWWWPNPN